MMIPFNRPTMVGREAEYLAAALQSGHHSGAGQFSRRAEVLLETLLGIDRVLLTTSGTHALELASRTLRLGVGDEVVVPSYTFVSSASAFAIFGARPVFADVSDLTLNLTLDQVEAVVTPRTKAVCLVHYAGIAEDVARISRWCEQRGIALVEDNAHGLGGSFGGQFLGTFGQLSAMSFHETKNVSCGEGGGLAVRDAQAADLAEILREKGTDRSRFLRGLVDKYTWVEVGSSWVLSDLLAAYLVAQLEAFTTIQSRRMLIWTAYHEGLRGWAETAGIRVPHVPVEASHPAHMYFLRLPSREERDRFIAHMRSRNIMSVFHYQDLCSSPVGLQLGGRAGQCPVSENAARTLVRLPLFQSMTDDEVTRVLEACWSFRVA